MSKGVLYVVATPIGNLDDFSVRAVRVLETVDLIAAEDTRHTRPLLRHYGISTQMVALHEHNEREVMGRLLRQLEEGQSLALVSDAGTPLISDPGFSLVREAGRLGIRVVPVPGVSAAICALSVAGLPTDRFLFAGFPPRQSSARRRWFQDIAAESATLVFYESSHRILSTLKDMAEVFGAARESVVARELTKVYETLLRGRLDELIEVVAEDLNQQKGEFVVLVQGAGRGQSDQKTVETEQVLKVLLDELPLKQAAALAAKITGEKKNALYQQALAWKQNP
ncbi:MAG: 16S rRNA (cytidine(1402)-2'-O)-methyltransferase [gamma proteobacterium endosymbiont of Lamellibrachia anaximandri]|nr:16S rRNA (cytidine(1402)-2'-O)-methyltransferase [gamma proteobacterium endosymbiont of Lamellibrachia anaximandri]MBL3533662.1 16S rRNA (cytidine(1402)-2'-O)-methyltransferase [gamma proteobacterium endosymbiont of Lamellibrachia anaximandri]